MALDKLQWERLPAPQLQVDPRLRTSWDRLNAQRGDLPFLCADAICAALAVFGDGEEILLCATAGQQITAMLVLVSQGKLRWTTFQPSQLPLGAWVASPGLSLPELAESAMRGPLGFCLAFSITQIDPLHTPRPPAIPGSRTDDYIDTAWLELNGSFDDYWAARGKNLRQNMRKQRNKLAADGVAVAMHVMTRVEDIAPALERYGALESAGWKADQGTAIHPDNAQGRFYRQLFEDAARRGEAIFFECLFADRTVAMNLCLRRRQQLIVLKTAYDESIKTLSPAFLLREDELKSFFADGSVKRIEYYGRVMDWHTKLTDARRTLYHFTHLRWAWLSLLGKRRKVESQVLTEA